MAAKKGKTKTAKVTDLKSRKLSAKAADQVKGGILISSNLAHKDMVAQKGNEAAWKLSSPSWKLGL